MKFFDPEKRAEIVRNRMMKNGKYLIARIEGTGQDPRVLDVYFRYYNYVDSDTDTQKQWLMSTLKEVWSPKFLGLAPNFRLRPIKEVKKLEFQNPAYSAAYRFKGKSGDPRNYNKVFVAQVSGCTYSCNFCYVPPEVNVANPRLGKFFSPQEIVDCFLSTRKKSKEPMNVIRITGGEPTIVPEIIIDIYDEMEKRGLNESTYLWIDTNLSTTKYIEKLENDLKNIMQKINVGVVGCFKGVCKEDFSMLTGARQEFYENQFKSTKLFLKWKTDFYVYLPALIYENNVEQKIKDFIKKLKEINKNLPLRVEMLEIKEVGGAPKNIEQKAKQGRPMPKTDQRGVFDSWYNKLLPEFYSKEDLGKYCCEVPLY